MVARLFTNALERAVSRDLNVVDLIGAVEQLKRAGARDLAIELYRVWLHNNSEHPLSYAVLFNYGVVLTEAKDLAGAKEAFHRSLAINKDFHPSHINLAGVHERLGEIDQALLSWQSVVDSLGGIEATNLGYKVTALKQIGRVLEAHQHDEHAEIALRQTLELDPDQADAAQHLIALRQRQCKWPAIEPWGAISAESLMRHISPLSLSVLSDDPIFQLAKAHHYNCSEIAKLEGVRTSGRWLPPAERRTRALRIGYLSSDLREHAIGFLTAEIYGLHDRANVEVFAYYCGIPATDSTQARIKSSVDRWVDITQMSDREGAARIVADGIDILVDINGYTKDARTRLLALRPAPIIVNWLGFPGTMASAYHNYIIADEFIVPRESEWYYSEKVMRLPCYQPTDRNRTISSTPQTRAQAGLPEQGVVFCCFNGTQKITPSVFAGWMKILAAVPGSVLWMLTGGDATNERLRQAAVAQGVSHDRLIFAGKMRNADHLARFALADLFLDTFPYGAHTTASDAMWMGVPVLTLAGRGFASRVCGSLVRAAGLPELVCDTFDDYIARAISIGNDAAEVGRLKDRLQASRSNAVLFDTPLLVRRLEALYREMWDDYAAGRLPVPDLANLDLYHEIGCATDHTKIPALAGLAYRAHYERAIAYRDSFAPIDADARLLAQRPPSPVQDLREASGRLRRHG